MKKSWLWLLVVFVIIVIGGIVYIVSNLNSIVARVIEEQGGRVIATEVDVNSVDISLREGSGTIAGLTISNPDGFNTEQAFVLGAITLDIDLRSLREDPVVIEEVRIQAPVVNAEFLRSGSLNIDQLMENIQHYSASQGSDGGHPQEESRRIRINSFIFEQGRIDLHATELGLEARSLDLPEINLENIGGSKGVPPAEIASAALDALVRKVKAQIATVQFEQLDDIRERVEEAVEDKTREVLDRIGR
jgi:hypothetical protein